MKKLLLLSAILIFACSSDDSSDTNNDDNNNNNTFICDGVPYDSIVYGTQEWTVENACHITYRDGTPIPQVTDDTAWRNLTTGAWAYYNNDPTNEVLYNWYAVAGIHDTDPNTPNKEFAQEGWHVPSNLEWTTLENYLIANGYNYDGTTTGNKIAKSMASTTGWLSSTTLGTPGNNQSTNNSSGFNAFHTGTRNYYGNFSPGDGFEAEEYVVFWSSTEYQINNISAFSRNLYYDSSSLETAYIDSSKAHGFPVRLVKD